MTLFGEPDPMQCPHPKTELARLIASNGASHIIRRCVDCDHNVTGGNYLPHEQVYERIEDLPVWRDYRDQVPPCQRCESTGAELHHVYPSAIDGREEADLWPTVWLCTRCHNRWHVQMLRAALDGRLGA